MKVKITGRHLTVSSALKAYIQDRMDRLNRYGGRIGTAQVQLEVQKYRHIAEAQVLVNGKTIQGKTFTREMYQTIDLLLEKLERQVKKQKEKLNPKRSLSTTPELPPKALKKKKKETLLPTIRPILPQLTVQEAVGQIGKGAMPFLIFMNESVQRVQIVHKMDNGQLQLIDPRSGIEKKP